MRERALTLDDALLALHQQPGPVLPIQNGRTGEVLAYVVRRDALPAYLREAVGVTRARDVRDLPRAARPKGRLSKRQRDAAKREKLSGAPVG